MKLTPEELRAAKYYAGAECNADNLTDEEIAAAKFLAVKRAEWRVKYEANAKKYEANRILPSSWEVLDAISAMMYWLDGDHPEFIKIVTTAALEYAKANESEYPRDRNMFAEYQAQADAYDKLVTGGL